MLMHIDATFAALADPTRRAILERLREGEATVNELVSGSGLTQPTVSRHIGVLERAGLVARRQAGQTRPCILVPEALREIDDWMAQYRSFWTGALSRLETLAREETDDRD